MKNIMKKVKIVLAVCLVLILVTMAGCTPTQHNLSAPLSGGPKRVVDLNSHQDVQAFVSVYKEHLGGQFAWIPLTEEETATHQFTYATQEIAFDYDDISQNKYVNPVLTISTPVSVSDWQGDFYLDGTVGKIYLTATFFLKETIGDNLTYNTQERESALSKFLDCEILDGSTKIADITIQINIDNLSTEQIVQFIQDRLIVLETDFAPLQDVDIYDQADLVCFATAYKNCIGNLLLVDLLKTGCTFYNTEIEFDFNYINDNKYVEAVLYQNFDLFLSQVGGTTGDATTNNNPCTYQLECKFYAYDEIVEELQYKTTQIDGDQYLIEIWSGDLKVADVLVNPFVDFDQDWLEGFFDNHLAII